MKQTAHEVSVCIAEGYWRIRLFKEAVERARCIAYERASCQIVKEARALEQVEHLNDPRSRPCP